MHPRPLACCLPNPLCMMQKRGQQCHLLLRRPGDKMQRHETVDGPLMGSPMETKTGASTTHEAFASAKTLHRVSGGSLLFL